MEEIYLRRCLFWANYDSLLYRKLTINYLASFSLDMSSSIVLALFCSMRSLLFFFNFARLCLGIAGNLRYYDLLSSQDRCYFYGVVSAGHMRCLDMQARACCILDSAYLL